MGIENWKLCMWLTLYFYWSVTLRTSSTDHRDVSSWPWLQRWVINNFDTTPVVISLFLLFLCLANHLSSLLLETISFTVRIRNETWFGILFFFSILWNRLYHRYDDIHISCQWIWKCVQRSQVSDCTFFSQLLSSLLSATFLPLKQDDLCSFYL